MAQLRQISHTNPSDLDFDLSKSLRSNVIILLDSRHMVSYYCVPAMHGLSSFVYEVCLENMSDVDIDLQGHKVKYDGAIELFIYDFLLISNSNDMSISHL